MASATHPIVGQALGNYVARTLIGEGGMGAVFVGEHRFLKERVAIKVLHRGLGADDTLQLRFFQEAKAGRGIDHPNVVRVFDFGQTDDGTLYLVMEFLEGEDLQDRVARGPLPAIAAAEIGASIASGIAAAHARGIVHRDLKPPNVFLTSEGVVKVLDFGIAKLSDSLVGTGTGELLGTPLYMAPEQTRGAREVGPHTDIYALGAILFAMLTGRAPFLGTTLAHIITLVLHEEPVAPSTLVSVPPTLDALVLQCLAKEPASRPASMVEVRDRLLEIAGKPRSSWTPMRVSAARPVEPLAATVERDTSSLPVGERVATTVRRRSGRSLLVTGAGVAAVIAGGMFAIHSLRSPGRNRSRADVEINAAPSPATSPPEAAPTPPAGLAVVVRSTPPGASLIIDGQLIGQTPKVVHTTLPHEITLRLDGFQELHEVLVQNVPAQEFRLVAQSAGAKPPATTRDHAKRARKPGAATPTTESKGLGLD